MKTYWILLELSIFIVTLGRDRVNYHLIINFNPSLSIHLSVFVLRFLMLLGFFFSSFWFVYIYFFFRERGYIPFSKIRSWMYLNNLKLRGILINSYKENCNVMACWIYAKNITLKNFHECESQYRIIASGS